MCLWVSYKEKYGKIIIFCILFARAAIGKAVAHRYMMMLATNMLVPRCGGSGIGFNADPDLDPAFLSMRIRIQRAYTGVIHCVSVFDQISNLQNCFSTPGGLRQINTCR